MVTEWKIINLSKNSKIKARIGWQGLTTAEYLNEGYSYLITGTDMKAGRVDWKNCHYVTYERYAQDPNIQVTNGDLLISKDGTIGKIALVTELSSPATLNSGVFVIRPITDAYISEYMFYVLESFIFKNFLKQLSAGSTINHLYQKDIVKFECILPPVIEQKRISELLSDMDALIVDLQKLIRKKKDIRQGTMQMLVTGKKRLPGYYADFEHFAIGELGSLAKTSINPCQEPKTIFDEYSMPAFDNGAKPQQMLGELMLSSRIKLTPNTLLFNKLNVRQRRVWFVKDCSNNSVCSSEFLPYKSEKIDLSFLKQLLLTDKATKDFEDMSSGTSNSQQRITPSDFLKYEISIPSLEEQREISSILLDMDIEIQKLEEKLSKCQKVKQGMMEELLTGKVRLM